MEIRTELIDELLKDYQKPEDIIGESELLKRFVKAVLERAMNAELTHHLGYQKHDPAGYNSGNHATERAARRSKANSANWRSTFPATAPARSSHRFCRSIKPDLRASTTRSFRCTRGA